MKALRKLMDSGMTRKQIAISVGVSEQAITMVFNRRRWPNRSTFAGIVRVGEERGIVLLAKDFVIDASE